MSVELLAMVAVLPILVALILMVGMRWPATKAMPLAWLVCAVSGILGVFSKIRLREPDLSYQGI